MLKKIYENIKKFIIENTKELIFCLGLYVFLTYPLPYYILVSGGTIDVSDRVTIEEGYNQEGSFNLAYVNELKGTMPTVLLSYVIPNWTLYEESNYTLDETESIEDINLRSKLELNESLQSSVKVAYEEAGKAFEIKDSSHYIYYVYDFVKKYADIKVGDKIISYDGRKLNDLEAYRSYVNSRNMDDEIELEIERKNKKQKVKLKVYEENKKLYTGIMVITIHSYETEPEVKFNFKTNESGPSGGLTLALAIYNKLTEEDITKGLTIVGTGTISEDGTVGAIGGVEYKLKGAVKEKADIFIVPFGSNYEDAKKLKEKEGYDIDIIEVSTFQEAIQKLKEYEKN